MGWLFALTIVAARVSADEQARVLIHPPERTDALLDEAMIRISGELRAVGLRVEVRPPGSFPGEALDPLESGDYGAIVLSQERSRIDIHAYAPGLETPVSQSAQRTRPGMDAEVVAVRAVEALRAAMIQYARQEIDASQVDGHGLDGGRPPRGRASLPEAVSDFTRITPPSPSAADPAPAPPGEGPTPDGTVPPAAPWSAWIGALGQLDLPAGKGQGGVHGALWWHPSWLRLGLSVQHDFVGGRYEAPEGVAVLQRTSLLVLVGVTVEPWSGGYLMAAAGPGGAHYAASAQASAGFAAGSGSHVSPLIAVQAGGGQWLTSRLGVYLLFGAESLTDGLRLRFDERDVAAAGRPTLNVATGLLLGL